MVKILVIGDLMIDHYIWGRCDRISPEAPVQVVGIEKETKRLGGCGNVISNAIALGANVGVVSIIGNDSIGDEILALLKERGASVELIVRQDGRKSSIKSRIMASHQQILRLDSETVGEVYIDEQNLDKLSSIIAKYDIVLLSDYGKGVLGNTLTQEVIKISRELGKKVLVDPKGKDYSKYSGATLLTPNKKEAISALGLEINSEADVQIALGMLKDNFNLDYSLITLSENGIAFFDDCMKIFPTQARDVFDVTGAGDCVLATLGYCLASNMDIEESIKNANFAAAVVVGKVGSADATWDEINSLKGIKNGFERKIITLNQMLKINRENKTIVFTNGCFDILHLGHISYLQKAKELGDILIIGLNSDDSINRIKGNGRPINKQYDRAAMLAALEFSDYIVIFDEDTPIELIKALRPNILVKGADYTDKKVIGSEYANKVVLIDFVDGKSTTNIIKRIKNA